MMGQMTENMYAFLNMNDYIDQFVGMLIDNKHMTDEEITKELNTLGYGGEFVKDLIVSQRWMRRR